MTILWRTLRGQSRDWLLLSLAGILMFCLGWVGERRLEHFISNRVEQATAKATKRFGIPIQIGTRELHKTSLLLTDIAVGQGQPIVIDKIEIGLGWNPFSPGFLRPSRIDIGRILVKDQVAREDRLTWLLHWKDLLAKRSGTPNDSATTSVFIPPEIHVEAAKILLADGKDEHTLITGLSAIIQLHQKRVYWELDTLVVKPRIEEQHLAGKASVNEEGAFQWSVKKNVELLKAPEWLATCEKPKHSRDIVCDIDASHIPSSIARLFAKILSRSAAPPGFHGSIRVNPGKNDVWAASVDGDLTGVYVTHKAISIDQIGPFSVGSRFEVFYDGKAKRIVGKNMKFGFAPDTTNERSVGINVDFDLSRTSSTGDTLSGTRTPLSGNVHIELPRTRCDDVLNAVPPGFAPDLQGFSLSGDMALEASARLNAGDIEFQLGRTMMDCHVANVPVAYTKEYLTGPFELERSMSDGEVVRIPVDPSRNDYTRLGDLPPNVVSAFITSEDAGFWQHHGIEPAAIIQALQRNAREGRAAVGGSTITMQTVKNLFLSRDKNISRKAQEIFLAWHLEQAVGKQRVLEIYLNIVEFGPGLYGVGAASRTFFGVPASKLSLKQGIYLASLLPAPIPRFQYFCRGSLTENYNRLVGTLLQRMLSLGRISSETYDVADKEPIVFQREQDDSHCKNKTAARPVDELPEHLEEKDDDLRPAASDD